MKVVIAIDSLKGSLSSMEAGMAIKDGILAAKPDAEVIVKPLADGGEGTTDALIEGMNGERIDLTVTGPMHTPVDAYYGYLKDTNTAVMEMASAAGITLVPDSEKNPLLATSYGVGEMINDAIQRGCRNFIIGIGGRVTNDGGIGMLKALGVRFLDENDEDAGEGGQALASAADAENAENAPVADGITGKLAEKQEAEGIHKNVIVIGRQYGCGGHDIGKKLAEKFGYEFYDQEIIQMIAGTTGMTSEFIRQKEESMTNSLLYDFVNQMYLYGKEEEEAPKDKIFEAESKVIRELAAKGKCVIIGRCSDYVLRENEKTLKLFFTAPLEVRAKRIMERLNISKKEAEQVIRKEDRRRADNYRYYTGRVWGSAANVDLTFNTAMNEKYIEECISKAMELEI